MVPLEVRNYLRLSIVDGDGDIWWGVWHNNFKADHVIEAL